MSRWKFGNSAGGAFTKSGDLWTSRWVTTPRGELKVLITRCGFRDRTDINCPFGSVREKVILDREIVDPPKGAIRK